MDNPSSASDGIIKVDRGEAGLVWNQKAPDDSDYISGKLTNHWIITDEDYKLLNKYKKNEKI